MTTAKKPSTRPRSRQKEKFHHLDVVIGKNLRQQRIEGEWSQQNLAAPLEITFQQFQKYENADNRLSCATAFVLSETMGIPVMELFRGLKTAYFNNTNRSPGKMFSTADSLTTGLGYLTEGKQSSDPGKLLAKILKLFCNGALTDGAQPEELIKLLLREANSLASLKGPEIPAGSAQKQA